MKSFGCSADQNDHGSRSISESSKVRGHHKSKHKHKHKTVRNIKFIHENKQPMKMYISLLQLTSKILCF